MLSKAKDHELRRVLEEIADELHRRGGLQAVQLMAEVAEERRLERAPTATIVQIVGRMAANQPGGVA